VAYEAGLKNKDYIYEVNGVNVFEMDHDQCTKLIKDAGDKIDLKIER
jgi:C-terminal processing protease CtpA/Prc